MKLFPNFSIFYTAGERGSLMLVTMWVFETSLFHFALFCWWGASCTPNVFWCQWENDLWGLICSELYCDHMHYTINIWSKYEKISRKLEFGTGCRSPLSIPVINFSFLRLKMDISWSGDQSLLSILNKFQKTFYRDVDFQRTNDFMKEVREVFNLSELKF